MDSSSLRGVLDDIFLSSGVLFDFSCRGLSLWSFWWSSSALFSLGAMSLAIAISASTCLSVSVGFLAEPFIYSKYP